MLRGVCNERLKFEIEYGLKRGTTDNSYIVRVRICSNASPNGGPCMPVSQGTDNSSLGRRAATASSSMCQMRPSPTPMVCLLLLHCITGQQIEGSSRRCRS
jgi:hypothetical protein